MFYNTGSNKKSGSYYAILAEQIISREQISSLIMLCMDIHHIL